MNFRRVVIATFLPALVFTGAGVVGRAAEVPDWVVIRQEAAGVRSKETVKAYRLSRYPVTNAEYLEFVRENPRWRRSQVPTLLADESYLKNWAGDLELGAEVNPGAPVVNVSWFAARAFASWCGARLPTTAEWEVAGTAGYTAPRGSDDESHKADLFRWLAHPTPKRLPAVDGARRNFYGVAALQGYVWEWVEDFNDATVTGESRADGDLDKALFCGGAAAAGGDTSDYAAFMRLALRASLKARNTTTSLGFRCAKNL